MSVAALVPNVKKARFTLGNTIGMPVVVPIPNDPHNPVFGVSSVSFLTPEHYQDYRADPSFCNSLASVNDKLVFKVRQFGVEDSSTWPRCFTSEPMKRARKPDAGTFTVTVKPTTSGEDSDDSQDNPHTVATVCNYKYTD